MIRPARWLDIPWLISARPEFKWHKSFLWYLRRGIKNIWILRTLDTDAPIRPSFSGYKAHFNRVGYARIDKAGDLHWVSYYIIPSARGRGWSRSLLLTVTTDFFRGALHARVSMANDASWRLLDSLGWTKIDDNWVDDEYIYHLPGRPG